MSSSENDVTEEEERDIQNNENDNLTESFISGDRSDSGIENLSSVEDSFTEAVPLRCNEKEISLRKATSCNEADSLQCKGDKEAVFCNEANSVPLQCKEGEDISPMEDSSLNQANSVPLQGKGDDETPYLDTDKDEEVSEDKYKVDIDKSVKDLPLTKDEVLRLQELLEDSDIPSQAEDSSDEATMPRKGFCHSDVEAEALNDIENRLKALLTKDEYLELHQYKKKYEHSNAGADDSEEYFSAKMRSQLQDIDKKLKDLYEKPFELVVSEDTVKKLVSESSKQLLKLKTEGIKLPELTEDDIQALVADTGIELIE